jgi:dipeptidyl aminopeptidase/acylaminoacyl peptidase
MALKTRSALLAAVASATLTVLRLSSAPAMRSAAIQQDRTAVTLPGAGIRLGGILVRPNTAGARPAIVLLHGFQPPGTNGAALMAPMAARFAALGYVALALSMRGWPPSEGVDDCGLRQPDDIAAALEWLARQSGVDPNRLAVLGLSQGGQVALLTGARSKRARAIVAAYPVADVERWKATTTFPGIPGYISRVCEPGGADRRSPVTVVADISAPILLIHGKADTRVPTEQTTLMRDALRRAGREVEMVLVPEMAHGFPILQPPASREPLLAFLTRTIGAE